MDLGRSGRTSSVRRNPRALVAAEQAGADVCGLWGYVAGPGAAMPSHAQAEACVRALRHRGPDDIVVEVDSRRALGHTRLAILDLTAAAAQPMSSPNGRFRLVFNGEVFNHVELRAQLEPLGYRFRGTGDTEVLAAAYQQWGLAALSRLSGMFALAVYDEADGTVLLARDRFGIKPLHYLQQDGMLAFSSEPKGLLPLLPDGASPDLAGISAFLTLRHVPAPGTLFHQLRQIPSGGWLRWQDGTASTGTWWRLPQGPPRPTLPWGRIERTRREVRRAVDLWSRSDVPVAALLSGGLDSSVLVTELTRSGRPVHLYTAEYDVPLYSEVAAARETAATLGQDVIVVPVRAAVAPGELARLIQFRDHPLGMHNEIAMLRLAAAVRSDGGKVMLCGEGADELLAGYGRLSRLPFELLKVWRRGMARSVGWRRQIRSRALRRLLEDYCYLPMDTKHRLLRPEVLVELDNDGALLATLQEHWGRPRLVRRHRRLMHFLLTIHLPGLLAVLDGDAMASGVEARTPFLEHDLVSWLYRLPQRARLRWRGPLAAAQALGERPEQYSERRDVTKWILRAAFADAVPKSVLTRRKQPFPAPLGEWFASPSSRELSDLVLEEGARVHDFLLPDELRRWWSTAGDGHPFFGRQAWMLVNLELWLRMYFPRRPDSRRRSDRLKASERRPPCRPGSLNDPLAVPSQPHEHAEPLGNIDHR